MTYYNQNNDRDPSLFDNASNVNSLFQNNSSGGLYGSGSEAGMFNGGGMSSMPWLFWARLIAEGKMQENNRLQQDPDDPLGNFGLAMLAPSGNQIMEDPVGMGLPTLLGAPWLTPFTASDESKQTKPEWGGLFGF